jgi:hypothetical protein
MKRKIGIIGLLTKAIAEQQRIAKGATGDNPQLAKIRLEAEVAAKAYQDCLDAVRGNTVMLRIAGGEGE